MIRADFRLQLGEISQQVEVTGAVAAAQYGIGHDGQRHRVPADCRLAPQWTRLPEPGYVEHERERRQAAPQITGLQGGMRALSTITIAGQRLEYNHYTLDGAENTDPNFNSYIVHPSVDAVQEFKVQTGIYSAEFGSGASQINVNTIPGTNQYHGAAFEFLRNSDMDAKAWGQCGTQEPVPPQQLRLHLGWAGFDSESCSTAGTGCSSWRISRSFATSPLASQKPAWLPMRCAPATFR